VYEKGRGEYAMLYAKEEKSKTPWTFAGQTV
jgi:hypothetical protein